MKLITHEKDVEIDGKIIKAEYYEWKSDFDYVSKKETLWDIISIIPYRIKFIVRDIYWKIRYGFERMFNGYDSVDVFETFSKFTERYHKILVDYKEHHVGYLCQMTNEDWEKIIDRMINCLYLMDEENISKELNKEIPEEWELSNETINKIQEEHKDEFFKLFSEYFYDLWD